jgi:hypothetical protein
VSEASADPLADARTLAQEHGLLILEKEDRIYDRQLLIHRQVTVWIVYRKVAGGRATRIGKRRNAAELLRLVRRCLA